MQNIGLTMFQYDYLMCNSTTARIYLRSLSDANLSNKNFFAQNFEISK